MVQFLKDIYAEKLIFLVVYECNLKNQLPFYLVPLGKEEERSGAAAKEFEGFYAPAIVLLYYQPVTYFV